MLVHCWDAAILSLHVMVELQSCPVVYYWGLFAIPYVVHLFFDSINEFEDYPSVFEHLEVAPIPDILFRFVIALAR